MIKSGVFTESVSAYVSTSFFQYLRDRFTIYFYNMSANRDVVVILADHRELRLELQREGQTIDFCVVDLIG